MGKSFAEKVLARAAGLSEVSPGEIVDVYPDLCMSNTASWRCIRTLEKLGTDKLYDPDRIAMVMDHISPARTAKTADDQRPDRGREVLFPGFLSELHQYRLAGGRMP